MSNRIRSDLWVSAFIARVHAKDGFALVARKGEAQAGAILISVENLKTRSFSFFTPASQSELGLSGERKFTCISNALDQEAIEMRVKREIKYDYDIWHIAVESNGDENYFETNELIL